MHVYVGVILQLPVAWGSLSDDLQHQYVVSQMFNVYASSLYFILSKRDALFPC